MDSLSHADFFAPDQCPEQRALERTTHLGVGAHQDDLEFMALHGILECYERNDRWFGAVICTDGAGSPRSGRHAEYPAGKLKRIRAQEQREAAAIGQYGFLAQLGYPSNVAQSSVRRGLLTDDLATILHEAQPEIVYAHNPFDRHPTHVGTVLALLDALERLPPERRPKRLIGCEVWRGLDWLPAERRLSMDCSRNPELAASLAAVFVSQIAGGKRYNVAVDARRQANATFAESHELDTCERVTFGVDMSPLIGNAFGLEEFVAQTLTAFASEIKEIFD